MNKNSLITIIVLAIVLVGAGWLVLKSDSQEAAKTVCAQSNQMLNSSQVPEISEVPDGVSLPDEYKNKKAVVQTNCGSFTIEFYDNDSPLAVENFIRLAQSGRFNGTPFHRVMAGFMVQSGDYTEGNGFGGASIWGQPFPDQLNLESETYKMGYKRGVVAMANSGPNTNGSQFFVMHQDFALPPLYTIFGQVTEGIEAIDKITSVPVLENNFGEPSVPTESIVIEQVTIENK